MPEQQRQRGARAAAALAPAHSTSIDGEFTVIPAREAILADRLAHAFAQALLEGRAAAAAACFAAGGRLLTADGTEVTGRAAVESVLAQLVGGGLSLDIRLGRTVAVGEVALATQHWKRVARGNGIEPFERTSKVTLVLCREGDRWGILIASPWG